MRRKTQRLIRRARQLRDRTQVSGVGRAGPTLRFDDSERHVLAVVFGDLQSKWVLHNDGALEMEAAVAASLQNIREIVIEARRRLPPGADAHRPLREIEAACAKFIHEHPGIERRDFEKPIDGAELDALFEVRIAIAEAVRDVLDAEDLDAAQELFNFIAFERVPETPWLPPGSQTS